MKSLLVMVGVVWGLSVVAAPPRTHCEVTYPEQALHIRGTRVYPDYVLNPGDAKGWVRQGSMGGNLLTVESVDCPGRPGQRGLLLTSRIDRKKKEAPRWAAWQCELLPQLNVEGVREIEFDLYPLQEIRHRIVARFGSHKGFGLLPCTWSSISENLKPNQWNTVRIPVHPTRKTIDLLRFDFGTGQKEIPHLQKQGLILGAIRFLPSPRPLTATPTGSLKPVPPLTAGYFAASGTELAGDDVMRLNFELAAERNVSGAELRLTVGTREFRFPFELKSPYTAMTVDIPAASSQFGPGENRLEAAVYAADGGLLGRLFEPMPFSVFSVGAVERERQSLKETLAALQARIAALKTAGKSVALPLVSATTAELFLDSFIPDDFNRQKTYRIAMNELADIRLLLTRLDSELAEYETGRLTEPPLPAYDPSAPLAFADGVIRQHGIPLLLIGPIGGVPGGDWARYARVLGFNSLSIETSLEHWLWFGQARERSFSGKTALLRRPYSLTGPQGVVESFLKASRDNGCAANLLLSSHYCDKLPPKLAAARDPGCGHSNFDWNVLAPEAKTIFERMYGAIQPYLKNTPHLVSLGTANEPGYSVRENCAGFGTAFVAELKRRYPAIADLNRAWGSDYAGFDSIDLASVFRLENSSPGAKVDWNEFMSGRVNAFFGFLKKTLLREYPDKQIWVKLMGDIGYFRLEEEGNIAAGQNVSGSDGSSDLWLDHLRSLNPGLPVTNQEWHFIDSENYSDAAALTNRMFAAVTRGLQSANIWRGPRQDWASQNNGVEQSFSRYPVALEAIGRASARLRMLYPALVRFGLLDGGAARIWYDRNAHLVLGDEYRKKLEDVYGRFRANAAGIRFLYPSRLNVRALAPVRLLAAGEIGFITPENAGILAGWVADGGTLWLSGPETWRDCYNRPLELPEEFVRALASPGVTPYGKGKIVKQAEWKGFETFLAGPLVRSGGEIDSAVECRRTVGPGGKADFLTLLNRSGETRRVRLSGGDRKWEGSATDLWGNRPVRLDADIELSPYQVMLLKL